MPLVAWECPKCKQTQMGFVAAGKSSFRLCIGSTDIPCRHICPGPEELPCDRECPKMCNTQMTVVLDERPPDQRGEDVDLETERLMTILRTCEAAIEKIRKRSESSYDIIKAMGVVFRGMKKA